jgi:MraZ protein
MDKQGRVQIPQPLRTYAALDKDVVVLGVADRVEIWDTAQWESVSHEADDLYSGIEESLSEEGI